MSAFVCNPTHIATCAEIVHEAVFDRHEGERGSPSGKTLADPPDRRTGQAHRADIRLVLARENLASVAWRYSDEGRAAYDWIVDALAASGWQAAPAPLAAMAPQGAHAVDGMVPGGSAATWLAQCRWAAPLAGVAHRAGVRRAEAWRYLDCMAYQSCEHPGWPGSAAKRWIEQAQAAIARDLVRRALGGRHVWHAAEGGA